MCCVGVKSRSPWTGRLLAGQRVRPAKLALREVGGGLSSPYETAYDVRDGIARYFEFFNNVGHARRCRVEPRIACTIRHYLNNPVFHPRAIPLISVA